MHEKKIILGIILHVFAKMVNIQKVLWMIQQVRVENIEEEMKTVTINFNEKMQSGKEKILYSTHSSINYHCIIYSR